MTHFIAARRAAFRLLALLVFTCLAGPVAAHPAPFSYLDLDLRPDGIHGSVRVHVVDVAHDLAIPDPGVLLHQHGDARQEALVEDLLAQRIHLTGPRGKELRLEWQGLREMPQDAALELSFRIPGPPPPELQVNATLFSYDAQHQTFVTIREGGALKQQWIMGSESGTKTHFAGNAAGMLATLATFIPSGFEHILIGPDHILFVIGLLLLGGSLRRMAVIVTSFTIGHSITLALAALEIVSIPAAIVEPLIALTIIVVGADNLIRGEGRDLRPVYAGVFGLIHGFGFAGVLREFGLPQGNLATALFGFNLGVELGQLLIVLVAGGVLLALRRHRPALARRIAMIGSLAVIAAGAYWFVTRLILSGG